jgi:SNF2 family DNA or RNA helicase
MEILDDMEWDEDAKQPVVVFSNFVGPLKLLQARFEKANENAAIMGFEPEYPYLWLRAEDDDKTRYNKWANLFPTLEYRVFMCTLQVGGESINLTPSRHVIFLDKSWSPKDMSQGIGRIRRPGQEGQPIVININARDTTDQYMQEVLDIKGSWFKAIFGEE